MILDVCQLVAHPETPPSAVEGVTCSLSWQDAADWHIDFMVDAPPESLRLPPPAKAARADGLWQHTCFEMFLLDPETGSYAEFNFSPSGEWAAYRFDSYRAGMRDMEVAAPWITSSNPEQFRSGMEAHFAQLGMDEESIRRLLAVPNPDDARPRLGYSLSVNLEDARLARGEAWRMGLSAVIEEADGTKSYWALAHPPGEPDFHHPDCFALELSPASSHAIRYRPPSRRP